MCPIADTKKSNAAQRRTRVGPEEDQSRKQYTEDQEEFLKKLPPELAKQCKVMFSKAASRDLTTGKDQPSFLVESELQELPVLMMLLEVMANAGQKVATLIDLASDMNYITNKAADRLNLRNESITLCCSWS